MPHLESSQAFLFKFNKRLVHKYLAIEYGVFGLHLYDSLRGEFKFPYSVLHGDHKNGDHEDNRPENIQTLCSICHHLKGLKSDDFVSAKKGRKLS